MYLPMLKPKQQKLREICPRVTDFVTAVIIDKEFDILECVLVFLSARQQESA